MTSPPDPRDETGKEAEPRLRLLAVTACPTGIAHTYMAAEKLAKAAEARGIGMKVETQGSIGAENVLTDNDVREADGIIIAADKDVAQDRFVGKRVLVVGVADGISDPGGLIEQVQRAPVLGEDSGSGGRTGSGAAASGGSGGAGDKHKGRSVGYKALMNGVSYMIPFVVVGGLLIAVSLALGGDPQADGGLVIPDDSFWKHVNDIGVIGFTLMVPILSGYIAYAIGDRPALVPGMIGGWIANTGELYDSESGAGFIGAIVTGFLAGYLVRWIKKASVPKFVQPVMPIIVIPIVATSVLGLFFIYVIGRPISWVFENLTDWLGGLTGSSAALLGVILGLMIAFDMGGPVNKTAFLFGAGLVSKNPEVMGMCAAAIPVPPLGQGLATLIRRRYFDDEERETGYAALFMGFFGITEGAIPFAAARPARVIPANMLGGAVAGAIAGIGSVEDNVPHGGPIVAVLGAIDGMAVFFLAVIVGTAVTGVTTIALMSLGRDQARAGAGSGDGGERGTAAGEDVRAAEPVPATGGTGTATATTTATATATAAAPTTATGTATGTATTAEAPAPEETAATDDAEEAEVLSGHLTRDTVKEELTATAKEAAIREMAELLAASGRVTDVDALVRAALAREEQGTTGLGEEIAIPHAKTDAVSAPVVGFARSTEGIEWGALDDTKARLVFMISVPEAAAGDEHLRILALLSRKLMDPGYRQRLLDAPDGGAILSVLGEIR
ncbi:fructose-specific PTS transporter subunit EIIC [Streptomyces sp. Z26]|uniref:fructose-specific PTS transporter subunit EIIC n=1 Tax=Streptomyces sp. Z26 TaxID=2500177 RepID=UPI000EF15C06|nr:fructose-specific PTS transporter subunit EIIC [Streptomyces sp. Z26]RLL67171.1 PTS fructose transporter subunit IIC [Streptomyces sp. Z26]